MNRQSFRRYFDLLTVVIVLLICCTAQTAIGQSLASQSDTVAGQQQINKPESSSLAVGEGQRNTKPEQPKTGEQQEQKPPRIEYSREAFYGAMVVLGVLAFLFLLQLLWSNRLERAGYMGQLFRDNLEDIEFKRLSSELTKRFSEGQFHNDVRRDPEWLILHPQPEGYTSTYADNRRPTGYTPPPGLGTSRPAPLPNLAEESSGANAIDSPTRQNFDRWLEEQRKKETEERKCEAERWKNSLAWDAEVHSEATKRYNSALEAPHRRAKGLAEEGIKVELAALRGRGPEFVLGFTTIVAIVFTAAALGVLGRLDSQQIGTLFAAIAGYVLGRASSRSGGTVSEQLQGVSPRVTVNVPREATAASPNGAVSGANKAMAKNKDKKETEQESASEVITV